VDTYAATKQATFAGLQGVVNRVLDDYRRRWIWLCFMPSILGGVKLGGQGCVKLLGGN
jgi:hypothetical protein